MLAINSNYVLVVFDVKLYISMAEIFRNILCFFIYSKMQHIDIALCNLNFAF